MYLVQRGTEVRDEAGVGEGGGVRWDGVRCCCQGGGGEVDAEAGVEGGDWEVHRQGLSGHGANNEGGGSRIGGEVWRGSGNYARPSEGRERVRRCLHTLYSCLHAAVLLSAS